MNFRRIAAKILQFPEDPRSLHDPYEEDQTVDRPVADLGEFRKSKETKDRVLMRIAVNKYVLMPWKLFEVTWNQYETRPKDTKADRENQYRSVCRKIVADVRKKASELNMYDYGGRCLNFNDSDHEQICALDKTSIKTRLRSNGLYVIFSENQIEYLPDASQLSPKFLSMMDQL